MFSYIHKRLLPIVAITGTVIIMGLIAMYGQPPSTTYSHTIKAQPAQTAPDAASIQTTDCARLWATGSITIRGLDDFHKHGKLLRQAAIELHGIPAGYTPWELLRDQQGRCYMHSLTLIPPSSGSGDYGLGVSVSSSDFPANLGDSELSLVVVIADQADSAVLASYTPGSPSSPASDRLVPSFGPHTYQVGGADVQITRWRGDRLAA